MVTPVLSIQCPVFRKCVAVSECIRTPTRILKHAFFLFFFLNTVHLILDTAHARELGVHGIIASIEEVDPLQIIHQKLKIMKERGELERHNLQLQKKTKAAIERPRPVEGIIKATKARVFYYDPIYVVKEELKDHQGKIIHSKGTRINPLETVSLSQGLLFFDGDDEDQVAFAKEKLKELQVKLILVKGAPLALSEEFKTPVYFDQAGLLTQKLRIKHIPALVTQEGMRLRIEEIQMEDL